MTSKWIDELLDKAGLDRGEYLEIADVLNRVDSLLKRAMRSTDDEALHDEIEKEIRNVQ